MVVEAPPASPFIPTEADLLLQVLIVSLDAPPEFCGVDQVCEADFVGQRAEPVLRRLLLVPGPFDEEPFFRPTLPQLLVAMGGSDPGPREPRCELASRALAPGDGFPRRGRQPSARSLTLTGWGSASRRRWLLGRPRPDQGFGGSPVPLIAIWSVAF